MTDGIELNGGQSEITEVPSSESENELVESPTKRSLPELPELYRGIQLTAFRDFYRLRIDTELSKQKSKGTWSDQSLALLITVMSLFAGAAYMVLFSFHDA